MNKRIELEGGWHVESWYDKHTRSWITQLKDKDGNQIGDAEYDGRSSGVILSQKLMVERYNKERAK